MRTDGQKWQNKIFFANIPLPTRQEHPKFHERPIPLPPPPPAPPPQQQQ